ncbi:Glycosyltransferase [Anopheles sinensis]|uniref:Glycosyltransferase n=1 Tax=Anopheles sinensis TaxID=74873 RepID=A0A084VDJ2_ANOSI|nr:Glycosyltransferase [Anopheles sinensis]
MIVQLAVKLIPGSHSASQNSLTIVRRPMEAPGTLKVKKRQASHGVAGSFVCSPEPTEVGPFANRPKGNRRQGWGTVQHAVRACKPFRMSATMGVVRSERLPATATFDRLSKPHR